MQMDVLCDQGCRPVGQAATVTSSHGGTILKLDHQTALLVVSQGLVNIVRLCNGNPSRCEASLASPETLALSMLLKVGINAELVRLHEASYIQALL